MFPQMENAGVLETWIISSLILQRNVAVTPVTVPVPSELYISMWVVSRSGTVHVAAGLFMLTSVASGKNPVIFLCVD